MGGCETEIRQEQCKRWRFEKSREQWGGHGEGGA